MNTDEIHALNARRIDAANALRDADAHLEALRVRWRERCMAWLAGHPPTTWSPEDDGEALAELATAQTARSDAESAKDEAEMAWSAAVTADRVEAEDDARAAGPDEG